MPARVSHLPARGLLSLFILLEAFLLTAIKRNQARSRSAAAWQRTFRGSTLHRAPVGQGPPGPGWLAISLGCWSGRALATGTAWAGLCLIHHHHHHHHHQRTFRGGVDEPALF